MSISLHFHFHLWSFRHKLQSSQANKHLLVVFIRLLNNNKLESINPHRDWHDSSVMIIIMIGHGIVTVIAFMEEREVVRRNGA